MEETCRYLYSAASYDCKVVGFNLLVSEVHSITVVSLHNHMSTTSLQLQRALVYECLSGINKNKAQTHYTTCKCKASAALPDESYYGKKTIKSIVR